MAATQVRIYRIKPGKLDAFVDEWRERVVPLRRQFGFEVLAAWASEEADTFVWILRHDGDYAAADREYYLSPERGALDPDPARLIEEPRAFTARSVPLP
jgi:NIPSNAP protein